VPKEISDCSWLAYNEQRRSKFERLAINLNGTSSLNVTTLSTIKPDGYLWAFPHSVTLLWLQERATVPLPINVEAAAWSQRTFHIQACALVGILFAENVSCFKGGLIQSGSPCRPQCSDGYTPSKSALSYQTSTFTPSCSVCTQSACERGFMHSTFRHKQ